MIALTTNHLKLAIFGPTNGGPNKVTFWVIWWHVFPMDPHIAAGDRVGCPEDVVVRHICFIPQIWTPKYVLVVEPPISSWCKICLPKMWKHHVWWKRKFISSWWFPSTHFLVVEPPIEKIHPNQDMKNGFYMVVSTPFAKKNICASQIGFHFPKDQGKNTKYLSCHQAPDVSSVAKRISNYWTPPFWHSVIFASGC